MFVGPCRWDEHFHKETERALCSPPCEDTMRKWLYAHQEVDSHQIPNLLAPWSWASLSTELWEINVEAAQSMVICCSSPNWPRHSLMVSLVLHVRWPRDHYFVQSHISSGEEVQLVFSPTFTWCGSLSFELLGLLVQRFLCGRGSVIRRF